MSEGRVARWRQLIRPVASLARAADFYVGALGFQPASGAARLTVEQALVTAAYGGSAVAAVTLAAGEQMLTLVELASYALPSTFDTGAGDPRFQHVAVIVEDMEAAWKRLRERAHGLRAISRDGPQRLPMSAGGVSAIKFRDPDGHPVELLSYDAARVPRHWRDAAARPREPGQTVLGIDHTAIGVADAESSIRFYSEVLGLTLSARQTNQGAEQERLDGLDGAVVDVVALSPQHATPHIELLAYRDVHQGASGGPVGVRGFTVLQVDDLPALIAHWRRRMEGPVQPRVSHHADIMLAHDPDGHALLLWQPTGAA